MILAAIITGLIGVVFGYWMRSTFAHIARCRREQLGRDWYRAIRPEEFDPVQFDDDQSEGWKKL